MSNQIHNHVLVIGGSHGISLELVRILSARDCQITAISRSQGELADDDLSGKGIRHIECDVVNGDLSKIELPNSLTGFVYCPGSIRLGPVKSAKPELLREDFELNVVGAMKCFQAAIPALRQSGSGSAVFFSTVAVNHGIAMHSYVAAAKGALQALAKTWAAELAPKIRVNCIAPALTETPLSANLLSTDEKKKTMAEKYPMGRYGTANDIAEMAAFLLSQRSRWITGQTIGVDGGMSGIVPL
ncbi:2-(S)-hydroxypropyl-CoM dehydrogenase [Stieleria maiorica]|uniref:2-(S)-hydroxypropyl-CoM dehydrogenase n=1 Tax=Stieleria maiorica TaxID=2795974 RepID=A0A5B9MGS9_9BACT|nr:SDR family oxidoreductase [Stieleria maiorica]QEG00482.1 2-(S)-hydroxypropyl-CoM dehydrogenase [Stieleria maiorica]